MGYNIKKSDEKTGEAVEKFISELERISESIEDAQDELIEIENKKEIYEIIDALPPVERVENMLKEMGCPTKFSEIGVRREVMEEMLEKAYTVRDRYTILTYVAQNGLTEMIKPIIMSKYF